MLGMCDNGISDENQKNCKTVVAISILPVPTYVCPWNEWPSFGITLLVVIMLFGLNTCIIAFHFVEGMGLMPL